MKTIIAGSRNVTDKKIVEAAIIASGFKITEVIEGGQRTRDAVGNIIGGVDWFARQWAIEHNIPTRCFPAAWITHGKAAGPIRNSEMAEVGEQLIAIPEESSRGTRDMIKKAEARVCQFSFTTHDAA